MQDISQNSVEKVKELLANASNITILTHLNPDADTLGTGLGIYTLLKREKHFRVEIVNASSFLPKYLDFLPFYDKIKSRIDFEESLVIACDCGSIDRLGFPLEGREILNIDHHAGNNRYGSVNIVMPDYASASQVAFRLFERLYSVDPQTATCFYTALFSDTQFFTTASVTPEVFAVAKSLVDLGADPAKVAQQYTQRRSLSSVRVLERALRSLTLHLEGKVATMVLTQEDIDAAGATMPDMDGIVDYARSLVTVEIGVLCVQMDQYLRVSLRSKTVDVSRIAAVFGGGGHKVAAGFTLTQTSLYETVDTILAIITKRGILHDKT